MPSYVLLLNFQEHLKIEDRWLVNGVHYSKTLDAWLKQYDENYEALKPILESTYGRRKNALSKGNEFFFHSIYSNSRKGQVREMVGELENVLPRLFRDF